MDKLINKATILIEALPYIREFYGKTIVVKYGGHAMVDENLKSTFAQDIVLLKFIGINVIIVHGGGPQIGAMLSKLNIPSSFVSGMRVTDSETMDVVEMVLSGKINNDIVNLINSHGGKAVGISGKDSCFIKAKKLIIDNIDTFIQTPEIIDLGHVGAIEQIDSALIRDLSTKYIPVIAPIGVGTNYETYNINADTVASYIAANMEAEKLILLTDISGIIDENEVLIPSLKIEDIKKLKNDGIIRGGMLPKTDAVTFALNAGVGKAHIVDGRITHSLLLEIFTDVGIGTQIVK